MQATRPAAPASDTLTLFDDRYGGGAFDRLLGLLAQPCVTFAQIASRFGVSRERVRQWQLMFMPEAPRGRARRRLCRLHKARRSVLADPTFQRFFRSAREYYPPQQIGLVRTEVGFSKRTARLDGHTIAIRHGRRLPTRAAGQAPVYVLTSSRQRCDYVYVHLDGEDFLFVPYREIPRGGTTFADSSRSRYQRYRNSFAAAATNGPGAPARAARTEVSTEASSHGLRRHPLVRLAVLAFVLVSAPLLAQTKPKADISVVTDADGVHAGATARIAVRASLPAGIHVQSNAPRDPFLIATAVTAESNPQVSVVETVYPPATDFAQVGQATPLAVFEQQFVVGLKLAIAAATAAGELTVPLRVRYQACNANTCFPPTTERLRVPLRVVGESVTPAIQLKDVFDALRFRP